MVNDRLIAQLKAARDYFIKTQSNLDESESAHTPADGMMTAAQQVAHTAHTVDWFVDGAFHRADGLDMDFASQAALFMKVTSLKEARAWLDKAFARAIEEIGNKTAAQLAEPIGGQIMANAPKEAIVGGIIDHTAHHRGALSVYTRTCGKVPPMPYM
ncbi:MAG: DinB family protein [Planctomycetota bacterium]